MQNYDSARVAYSDFIQTTEDTALVPKAMYSQAYIYNFHFADSIRAKSTHDQIISDYPQSLYALHLLEEREGVKDEETLSEEDEYKEVFLQAEQDLFNSNYEDAIESFLVIAEDDSGSIWAEKSRYAIAWTYEHHLDSVDAAINAYELIVAEYPNAAIAKIAQNKIKPPPEEKVVADSTVVSDSLNVAEDTEGEENQTPRKPIDRDAIDDEGPDNRRKVSEDNEENRNTSDEN